MINELAAPLVGAILYLLFGENRLGKRRLGRITAQVDAVVKWQSALKERNSEKLSLAPAAEPIQKHAERPLGFPVLGNNQLTLFDNFHSVFDSFVSDINAAQTSCDFCFYIWHEGGRVDEVIDALVPAAKRGVRCCALADAMGSKIFLKSGSAHRLREAGVQLTAALPTGLIRTLFARADLRNHRKTVVIDDIIAYTGSQNLVDPRFFKQNSGVGEWADAVARITGSTVKTLDAVFELDWAVENSSECKLPDLGGTSVKSEYGAAVQVVPLGPDLRPEAIHQLLLTSIYSAKHRLVMTTP